MSRTSQPDSDIPTTNSLTPTPTSQPPETLPAKTRPLGYQSFNAQLAQLIGETNSVSLRGLFNRLRDPQDYMERISKLTQYAGPSVETMTWSRIHSHGQALRTSRYQDTTINQENERTNFETLPALVTLHLELEDHEYVDTLLVRWTDLARQEVLQLELHQANGLGGSQLLQSMPRPDKDASRYQVDIFDADEALTPLGSTTISIDRPNSSTTFQSANPSARH